jgi:signal peptidase II
VKRSLLMLFAVAGFVFALDQWTKRWATEALMNREPVPVLGEVVRFTFTRNSGVAFGLGAGTHFPFYIFSLLAVAVILALFVRRRVHGVTRELALSLIFGGALGNLVDRLTTGLVVDFIEVGVGRWHFPVFNVADSAVTIGVVLFALRWTHPAADAVGGGAAEGADEANPEPAARGTADARDQGAGAAGGRAAGSLPGGGAGGPVA